MDYPDTLQLWSHQSAAVEIVASFLDAHAGPRAVGGRPSALVNIPTGGGKTAVIATLAHWHDRLNRVLVLAPRTAIRDQLVRELGAARGFLLRQGFGPDSLPKRVVALNSATDVPEPLPEATIFVASVQLVTDMAGEPLRRHIYDHLGDGCDAVMIDEGHYEPARSWSQVLRGLGRPSVLVTATPYRNDLKAFAFDENALHISRYSELVTERILRPVEVVSLEQHIANDPAAFVDSVLTAFVQHYGQAPSAERKLIIRCRARDQIQQLGELIRVHRLGAGGVICLHENFTPDTARAWERRQPSDPEAANAPAIWVHQHKLLEGVDGPSFRAVAFYGVLGSARALVQQIGRVIRNPARDGRERALMLDHSGGFLEHTWKRFLAYDSAVTRENLLQGLKEFATAFELNLPSVIYADRQFRQRLDLAAIHEPDLRRSLRLPLRCHLYNAPPTLNQLADATRERMLEAEFPFQIVTQNEEELIVLFAKLQTSPLLADHYFIERELHVFIAQRIGGVVAVLDTSRAGLDQLGMLTVGRPLSRQRLARLLVNSPNTRLVEVNSRNAALGPSAVRRRSSTAPSLDATPPTLDEFQYVVSSLTAMDRRSRDAEEPDDPSADRFSLRSIGFGRGRISEASPRATLEQWTDWISRIVGVTSDATRPVPGYLDRYAHPLENPPALPWPRSVLLDLEEARQLFVPTEPQKEEIDQSGLEIDDVCLDCRAVAGQPAAPRPVTLIANGVRCTGTFEYLSGEQRYQLASPDLERVYRYEEGTRPGTLVEYLNTHQAFVVVPDAPNAIYSEGGFYDPRLKLGSDFDPVALGLSELIETFPALATCRSEKGARGSAGPQTWATGSVFRWIDDNADLLLPNAELVLCDDGVQESCDFLLAGRQNNRDLIVMVHAKASKRAHQVSASAFHEVCGQAAKQIGMLALFGPRAPQQIALWDGTWNGPGGEGRVDSRLRRARGEWAGLDGPGIWQRLLSLLERQGTDRQVVMILGASLVRARFFEQARKKKPPAPAVHVMHLIRATMSAVVGGGARLRIFCS